MPRKKKTYPELDAVAHLLGTMPDADVAKMANASASIVGRYRRERNIAAYQGYKFGFGGDEAAAPASRLRPRPEASSADAPAGRPGNARRSAAARVEDRALPGLVGQRPDREVAEMAGVTPEAVRMYRRRHGIPSAPRKSAASASSTTPRKPRKRRSKLDPFSDLLGTVPDAEVAAMAGVTSENVRAYRRRHGISADWRNKPAAPAAAPVAEAAPAPPRRRCGARRGGRPSGGRPGLQRRGRGRRRDLLHHRDGHRLGGGGGPQGLPAAARIVGTGSGDRLTSGVGSGVGPGAASGCVSPGRRGVRDGSAGRVRDAAPRRSRHAVQIADYLPSDADAAARAALTANAYAMQGSMILGIAGQVRACSRRAVRSRTSRWGLQARPVPHPRGLSGRSSARWRRATNYPPSDGVPKRARPSRSCTGATSDWTTDRRTSASRRRPPHLPPGRSSWSRGTGPPAVPMWNVGYYAHLFRSDHRFIPTTAEANFFPTVEQCREAVRDSRLVVVNTPLNPTGTAASREVIEGLGRALVEENAGRERPCMLLFDQVYWMLTAPGTEHYNPVQLVPECAPYVVHVDAISKCFAGTGLRLGWGVLPPYLQRRMKSLVGHVGSWAPRAEQLATAWFLSDPARVSAYMTQMNADVQARLDRLNDASSMRSRASR